MKRLLSLGLFLVTMLVFSAGAHAYTLTWVPESKDYAVGETVSGWTVLEYKDAVAYNSNGVWTTSGSPGGDTRPNGATIMWFYYGGNYAETTLSTKSTAVAFMVESDSNDMYVNFYVDGNCVLANYDMMTLPGQISYPDWQVGTLVVSGLDYGTHTIKIQSVDTNSYRDDFHLYGGAAVAPVPLPAAVWLLGPGLLGILGIRRKMNK
ncbi:VPLPA-CTERM protein sorting domain-containing protein [Syntrophus gentianae]|uniref:VPLPA-CTERM protein sorting domain-containing protein n=1 Tax=Syntrophus gentianae TaxID=43775 RepID=A0A1H8AV86_9BACT|nr:hypothetical protein [Syntrophus gentianae]SEM73708.1 VPLPA-CTERM protein sorting domain-containing protein [Syntrophus gentianae]